MVLDRQSERVILHQHRLGQPILGPSNDLDVLAWLLERLVMEAVDGVALLADDLRQGRPFRDGDPVRTQVTWPLIAVVIVLDRLWPLRADVLIQRAALGNVER